MTETESVAVTPLPVTLRNRPVMSPPRGVPTGERGPCRAAAEGTWRFLASFRHVETAISSVVSYSSLTNLKSRPLRSAFPASDNGLGTPTFLYFYDPVDLYFWSTRRPEFVTQSVRPTLSRRTARGTLKVVIASSLVGLRASRDEGVD